jgi:hypothetical protein
MVSREKARAYEKEKGGTRSSQVGVSGLHKWLGKNKKSRRPHKKQSKRHNLIGQARERAQVTKVTQLRPPKEVSYVR